MDWTKILNKFRSGKKQKAKTAPEDAGEVPTKQMINNYFTKMTADLNYRLLCETAPFLPPQQVLWVEKITVTGFEYSFGGKKERQKRKHKIFPLGKFCMPYKRQKER